MSNHSFVIFSVSVCEIEASYSLPEFIFSSLYLIPLLTVSVNLLLHKPFPYSGIFNIILILSSSTLKKKNKKLRGKKKKKDFFKLVAFLKWCLVFSPPSLQCQAKILAPLLCLLLFQWFFFFFFLTSQPWHCYLAPFWNFYFPVIIVFWFSSLTTFLF